MSEFQPYLARAASGEPLTANDMRGAMNLLLSGDVSNIEIAGFLMALRARGETIDEIAAAVETMRSKAVNVEAPAGVIDTCGTGGDGANTFNISTATALVLAGAGVQVAKHGNKAASSKSGSVEVLTSLGVNPSISPAQISKCIEDANVGFMFAPLHHGAVGNVANVRKTLGVRTIFNVLGPLSNPAGAKRQLMGVYSKDLVEPLAHVLLRLGAERAWVVHGADGLDELTTTGKTYVAEVKDGAVSCFTVSPEDAGIERRKADELTGGEPPENAKAVLELLDGERGAYRDIVLLNAAAGLMICDRANNLKDGAEIAADAIDNGKATVALDKLIALSN